MAKTTSDSWGDCWRRLGSCLRHWVTTVAEAAHAEAPTVRVGVRLVLVVAGYCVLCVTIHVFFLVLVWFRVPNVAWARDVVAIAERVALLYGLALIALAEITYVLVRYVLGSGPAEGGGGTPTSLNSTGGGSSSSDVDVDAKPRSTRDADRLGARESPTNPQGGDEDERPDDVRRT